MQGKSIAAIYFILFSIFASAEANSKPKTAVCKTCAESQKFDKVCPVITAPCSRSKISEIDTILDKIYAAKKPIVLYVHGRGNEPKKTLKEHIVETLEKDYGIKVLMFNWNSKALLLHRPVNEALEGGVSLRNVIERLAKYRLSNPDKKVIPVSLLVHSMGNIAFRKAMEEFPVELNSEPVFTNILMTGSDEDAEGHNIWVEQLKSDGTILITFNEQDGTLSYSHHPDGKSPLGLNPKLPLANNAYYMNVTGLVGKVHRVFTKGKQHNRVGICNIFTSMLRGEKLTLTIGSNIKEIKNERFLVPIDNQDTENMCFQGVKNDPDEENEK